MEMIDLYVDTDHQSYEKYQISRWLRLESKSHVTREPMQTNCLMQEHTMKNIISSMIEWKIIDELIVNIRKSSSDTK